MVGAERIFRLLDMPPAWTDTGTLAFSSEDHFSRLGMHVEFENLWFWYETERPVLKGISLQAIPGQNCLVGHTGSGKTSVTNLISKLYLPQEGALA
jgi:ATP-binding cassette subfamily B protein